MKRNIIYALLLLLAVCLASCRDDEIMEEVIGTGESRIEYTMTFHSMMPVLDGKTRTAGDALDAIKSLCVLLYDEDKDLVERRVITDYTVDEKTLSGGARKVSFGGTVPYGRYYIYAVANMGDLSNYEEKIKTVSGLKDIEIWWVSEEIEANNQMFGYFRETQGRPNADDFKGLAHDSAQLLTINRKSMSLYAPIYRAASKVTIAYDGSRLAEGVFVYIKSVTIRDIPLYCTLGKPNKITEKDKDCLSDGGSIAYYTNINAPYDENWPAWVAKGRPYYPYNKSGGPEKLDPEAHSEQAEALFFYENMQGEGKDKAQDRENMGDKSPEKDNMPYGTYIEVEGYYRSINKENVSNGPIKYRFMLGKDTKTNYDAERNHHYKLTLRFNKFANDADWHIDYTVEKPSVVVPEEYYISYLYNREMQMPITINTNGRALKSLKARILTNNWAPYASYDDFDYYKDGDYDANPTNGNLNRPWNGFLSLRKTKYKVLTTDGAISNLLEDDAAGIHKIADNKTYYNDELKGGYREYVSDGTIQGSNMENEGTFEVVPNEDGQAYVATIPLYTRAKQLIAATAYTGNNPYVAYRRRATVEIEAVLEPSTDIGETEDITLKDTCEVFQMRRVVNPKGIYRQWNSTESFRVNLKVLPKESATEFIPILSIGPWRATVVRGEGNISLSKTEGSSGSEIDFTVRFNGTCATQDEVRSSVIRVEYNNYTCQHLIFVRQGYAPITIGRGTVKWHTFNLESATNEVDDPRDEGSMFKFGNLKQPIAATNQTDDVVFQDGWNTDLWIVGSTETKKWNEITPASITSSNPVWGLDVGTGVRIATVDDYKSLIENDIEFNYGVLYADGATETATNIKDAYGYRSADTNPGRRGMRGCFVYDTGEGHMLFFPIGASGYGRRINVRKNWNEIDADTNYPRNVLAYSVRRDRYPGLTPNDQNRYLFYDICIRPGANYWCEKRVSNMVKLDINYFTFDFDMINAGDSNADRAFGDACFVRCVED